jgi:hypothetical protein
MRSQEVCTSDRIVELALLVDVNTNSLLAITFTLVACVTPAGGADESDDEHTGQPGDGDGDGELEGDGDGDGDGEPEGDGDGDGEPEGDGDGDETGLPDPPDIPGSDCGTLQHVFTIDLVAELELPSVMVEAVELTEDGGFFVAHASNNSTPAVRMHRFDAAGQYMFSIERDGVELSNAGTRARARPSGDFVLLWPSLPQPGLVVPRAEGFDAGGASLWTWSYPTDDDLDTRFLDIGADGSIMAAGGSKGYGANYTWIQLFAADGTPGPQLGGADAQGFLLGEMQLGGAALAANGNVVIAGRRYEPNDLWVAELDPQGNVVWQTLLTPGDLAVKALMIAADGLVHVASVSTMAAGHLYLLDQTGELLSVNLYIGGEDESIESVTLLGGADPLVLKSKWQSPARLRRFGPVGQDLEQLELESITPTVVRSDGSCRAIVGGLPAQIQMFEG